MYGSFLNTNKWLQKATGFSIQHALYLGFSVSYQRVDDINLATFVCEHFKSVGVVCPLSLQSGLFTVGAIDSLDHDPSTTRHRAHFMELG